MFGTVTPFDTLPIFSVDIALCVDDVGTTTANMGTTCDAPVTVATNEPATFIGDTTSGNFEIGIPIGNIVTMTFDSGALGRDSILFSVSFADQGWTSMEFDETVPGNFLYNQCGAPTAGALDTSTAVQDGLNVRVDSCTGYDTGNCAIIAPLSATPVYDVDPGTCTRTLPIETDISGFTIANPDTVCPATFVGVDPAMSNPFAFPVGTTAFEYSVTGGSGQTPPGVCGDSVTVQDTEPPVITCPGNIGLIPVDASCMGDFIAPNATATDNCSTNITITGELFNATSGVSLGVANPNTTISGLAEGNYFIRYNATDGGGFDTCDFSFQLLDLTDPVFPNCPNLTNPVNLTATDSCSAVAPDFTTFITATDNCGIESVVPPYPNMAIYPVGTTRYSIIATDINDLDAICEFDVNVMDIAPPTLVCPTLINVTRPAASPVFFNIDVMDNCPAGVTFNCSMSSGNTFPLGTTPVTCDAYDSSDNAATPCTFDVILTEAVDGTSFSQTPSVILPSASSTNSETRQNPPPATATRTQVAPSDSATTTRSPNPSASPTGTPSSTVSASATRTPSATATRTPTPSISSSNTRTPTQTPEVIPPSDSRSPYIPSASPTTTPEIQDEAFVQQGENTLVELIVPCREDSCTVPEANFYMDQFAIELDIPSENIYLESIFGTEITFIVCGSEDVADLLNQINFSASPPPSLADTFVEGAVFNVACPNANRVAETEGSSSKVAISSLAFVLSFFAII